MSAKVLALGLFVFAPLFANAHSANMTSGQSCEAPAIQEFLCPDGTGNYNQYFDNGCSITCDTGKTATCTAATCADDQSGQEVPSSCTCN